MLFTHWQNRSRPAPAPQARAAVRPALESLELREAPVGLSPTSLSFPNISEAFNFNPLAFQQETVNVQVSSPGTTVGKGQVTISDLGQTQTVGVNSSGQASASFTFNIFQAGWLPHTVSASYSDPSGLFDSSNVSTQTPDATGQALPFIAVDLFALYAITLAFTGALSGAGANSSGSGSMGGSSGG